MFACNSSAAAPVAGHIVRSRVALAAAALMLAGGSTLAVAQDVFSSAGGNTGQWNPQGPLVCQAHVDQYNALTPKIHAAAKDKKAEERSALTKQRTQKMADYRTCVKGESVVLKALGGEQMDTRMQWSSGGGGVWIFTDEKSQRWAFDQTVRLGGIVWVLQREGAPRTNRIGTSLREMYALYHEQGGQLPSRELRGRML